ncbi:MAG: signal peptide peptidase SppA [Bacteroidaceae bacterium]|nr:signal peptide peptidase SppA [Bacteroidaceae bacterium]
MRHFSVWAGVAAISIALFLNACSTNGTGVLKIDFKSPVTEQGNTSFSLSSFSIDALMNGSMSLYSVVSAIDAAATDSSISCIYMRPDNLSASLAQMEEIRASLKRFRDSGKSIIAYCESLTNESYYIASVADRIVLNPASENYITGLATSQLFLKDALDALGVDVQLIRHGKYKSAGEMFTRSDFSKENYEQNKVMVTSLWNSMCQEISDSRGLGDGEFAGWVDNLSLTAPEVFKEYGLVDELWHKDQLDDYICEIAGIPVIKMVRFVSLKKYIEKQAKVQKKRNKKSKGKIAVVYANGEIVMSSDQMSTSGDVIVGRDLASTLAKVRNDDNIKAVVFRVNSPGGSVVASELIKRELDLLRAKKPVVASYGDYAASGGYWISAEADRIFTDRTTLTGSIGCFSMIPNVGGAFHKIARVNIATVGSSKHSDMMAGMRQLDEAEVEFLQNQVEEIYDRFTTIVSNGRKMSKDSVDNIAQGRVWAGSDALDINLTDEVGGLKDAIAYAAGLIGVDNYGLVEYPESVPFSFMSLLASDTDLDETVTSDSESQVSSMLGRTLPFAAVVRRSKSPVMMARMPVVYSFD